MKKIAAFTGAMLAASIAFGASIPLQTGPVDPAAMRNVWNTIIQAMNLALYGQVATLAAPVATTDTSADVLFSTTLGGGQLNTGQTFHIYAYGVNSSTADARTIDINFGLAATCEVIVTGSAVKWFVDFNVTEVGPNAQNVECHGRHGTVTVTSAQSTGTEDVTGALAVTLTGTAAGGTSTLNEAWANMVR